MPINILAQPLKRGGYNVPDIALYCDIFFLRPVKDYIRHRRNFTPATAQTAMTEFQIGLQLSNLFNLLFKNSLPHISRPNIFYAHTLALLKKYKLNSDQLYKCSLHQLYRPVALRPHASLTSLALSHRDLLLTVRFFASPVMRPPSYRETAHIFVPNSATNVLAKH